MESEIVEPRRIDFSECVEDEHRENLPVYLRIKPQKDREMSITVLNSTTIETNHAFRANKRATYTRVFPGSSSQQELFDGTSAHLVRKFLDGANVMTFAYGVTSSGKTHTIMGSHVDPGILPRTLEIIFGSLQMKIAKTMPVLKPNKFDGVEPMSIEEIDQLENLKSTLISKVKGLCDAFDQYVFPNTTSDATLASTREKESPFPADTSCSVWISIYEIHNEVITDLFSTEAKDKRKVLNIGQDPRGRTFIKDLMQVPVCSASEAYALLQFARQNLATASTKLNDNSSRSHMVFNLKMVHWGGPIAEPFVNQFVVSDLAGSERQAKTGTSGFALKQAGAINNSLLVLGRCLEALRKKDKGIAAPFRDSKLTRMLNPFFSLGGYVSLIICINPGIHLQDETMETVRFSAIASEIVQNPIKPLDSLCHLRTLTLESRPMFDDTDVESWQDAVYAAAERNGVAYLEVKASYFNDMARDILRAEKLLAAKESEIDSLKQRLKESDVSKENIKMMYQDRMKEQRDKFAELRVDLEELHRDLLKTLVEEFEGDIRKYREKYSKYRDGYAKLSNYIKDKLWPEVCLFRDRFGCLPEFPPRDGPCDEEIEPKNTIKYWRDKLHDQEVEFRSLRTELSIRAEQFVILEKELEEQKKFSLAAEMQNQDYRREIAELVSRVEKLTGKLASVRSQLSNHGTLVDETAYLERNEAEGKKESLEAQHQTRLDSKFGELDNSNGTFGPLVSLEAQMGILSGAEASPGEQGRSCNGEGATQFPEKNELQQKIVELETELCQKREQATKFQVEIQSLQGEVKKLAESEAELKQREIVTAFQLRDVRRARAAECDVDPLRGSSKRLQRALKGEKKALAAKNILVGSQKAESAEFESKLKSIEALGRQMRELSRETEENGEALKVLLKGNRLLDVEIKQTEQLEAGVECRTKRLEKRHGRILRDFPQPEKAICRLRSASSAGVELKVQSTTEKPRRRMRLGNEENSILNRTSAKRVRHSSPASTTRRTRSSRKC